MNSIFDKYLKKNPITDDNIKNDEKNTKFATIPVAFGNAKNDNTIDSVKYNTNAVLKYDNGKPIINISQSLIKQFTTNKGTVLNYCPFKIYTCFIIKSHSVIKSLPMLKGNYFETLCLGGTSSNDKILDLPRTVKPLGQKTLDQIRIENQAIEFKRLCQQYGINILPGINTQIKYKINYQTEYDDRFTFYIKGIVDIVHPIYHQNEFIDCVIDLKLTENINNSFGPYAWGKPEYMDHIQFDIYNFLSGKTCLYWVFDYSKNMNQEIFMHNPDEDDIKMMHARIKQTIIELTYCFDTEFPQIGSFNNCKDCPHNPKNTGSCQEAINIKVV